MQEQLKSFTKISIPKFIETEIKNCALSHLSLSDMGKLRDMYEGQSYYNKLRKDIISEFAFEKYLGSMEFNWEKRRHKGYVRNRFRVNDKNVYLLNFTSATLEFPSLDPEIVDFAVFIYLKQDSLPYISGLADKMLITRLAQPLSEYSPMKRKLREIREFNTLLPFSSMEELQDLVK
jgi:hypothetical protein